MAGASRDATPRQVLAQSEVTLQEKPPLRLVSGQPHPSPFLFCHLSPAQKPREQSGAFSSATACSGYRALQKHTRYVAERPRNAS